MNPSSPTQCPDVSVIVPVYNAAEYLEPCLHSLLASQTASIEVICVDDGSSDRSAAELQRLQAEDPRIIILQHPANRGAAAARNTALAHARGRYTLFADADDAIVPGAIDTLVRQADSLDCDAIKGLMVVSDATGRRRPHRRNQRHEKRNLPLQSLTEIQLLYQYTTYLFRTSSLQAAGTTFDTTLKNFQDPDFLSRLLPQLPRITLTLTPVYIRMVRSDSIVSSQWGYANFESLVRGITQAAQSLEASGLTGTASVQSRHFQLWWHKFERMPDALPEQECLEVLSMIHAFTTQHAGRIYQFSPQKAGAYHALRLAAQGRVEDSYREMRRSLRVHQSLGRLVGKLADLIALGLAMPRLTLRRH